MSLVLIRTTLNNVVIDWLAVGPALVCSGHKKEMGNARYTVQNIKLESSSIHAAEHSFNLVWPQFANSRRRLGSPN